LQHTFPFNPYKDIEQNGRLVAARKFNQIGIPQIYIYSGSEQIQGRQF